MIPEGRGVLFTGLGGSSKTRIVYHLAVGAVIGHLPFGWEVERIGRAVLVLTEDVAEDVHRTLFFMAKTLRCTAEEKKKLAENLIVYPMAGREFKLLVRTDTGTVVKGPQFHELARTIKAASDVVFVAIDPALGITEGDEMDQNHQRQLGKAVDDLAILTGATVALVSHATKASLQAAEMTSHSSRGGGAITDAVRAEYAMRNMTAQEAAKAGINDPEERRRYVQLAATKGNQLPPAAFVPIWLRRDDFGSLVGTEITLENDRTGTPTAKDLEILSVHDDLSRSCTPDIGTWRAKCIELGHIKGKTEDAKIQAMKRVCDRLKNAGLIVKGTGKGVWLRADND